MKDGGLFQWNYIVICDMSKASWQTGKLCMKDDSENHSKDHKFFYGAMVEHHPISPRDWSRIHQFGKNV